MPPSMPHFFFSVVSGWLVGFVPGHSSALALSEPLGGRYINQCFVDGGTENVVAALLALRYTLFRGVNYHEVHT